MKWQVMVKTNSVNVRTGPSTSYRSVGTIGKGEIGVVVDSKTVGGSTWYKWEDGTWSCATSSTGENYIGFVYNMESENNIPGGNINQPSNNGNNGGSNKNFITPDNLYSFYESDYGEDTNNVSFGNSDDWYIESKVNLKDKTTVTDEQIRDEISRIKYNMDISYATKDDVYELGKGSIGYLTDLQKKLHHSFNRNKIAYPDRELTKTFAYVFFTRPDLNILTYGSDKPSEFSIKTSVVGSDPKYSYIFHNNQNTLRSLVSNGNPYHKFLILLSNEAQSFEVADTVIKTVEDGETYNGNKIIYGRTDHESNTAGEFNIRYVDSVNLDVFKLHLIWVDYINKVSRGVFEPKEEYMKRKILDYACSCYYFLCGPDGSTILYWQKLTGVFPVNTGENTFSWDSGTLLSKPEINIRYMYSMRSVMDIAHLSEFNALTKANGDVVDNTNLEKPASGFKSAYSPEHIQTGSTLTHSPYIWQTKDVAGNMIFRLMWCGN